VLADRDRFELDAKAVEAWDARADLMKPVDKVQKVTKWYERQ
jgi:hypothetical protein